MQRYDILSSFHISEVSYDLQARRYLVVNLQNQEIPIKFNVPANLKDFSPSALRRSGR